MVANHVLVPYCWSFGGWLATPVIYLCIFGLKLQRTIFNFLIFFTESNKVKVFECLDSISFKNLYSRNLPLSFKFGFKALAMSLDFKFGSV